MAINYQNCAIVASLQRFKSATLQPRNFILARMTVSWFTHDLRRKHLGLHGGGYRGTESFEGAEL